MRIFDLRAATRATDDAGAADAAASADTTTTTTTAAAAGAADGAAAKGDEAAATTTTEAARWRPEGLPDHLFGKDDRDTTEKLWTAYKGARDAIAKAGDVPKDVAGYVFQPSEKVAPYAEGLDADPFFGTVRELALEQKMPTKMFQSFIGGLMEKMVDQGIVAEAFSPEKERKALVPDVADPKARAEAADRIVQENTELVKVWTKQGLPEEVANDLLSRMNFAATNKLVDWIRESRSEQRPALGGTKAGTVDEAELDRRIADPRNNYGDPAFDPKFAAATTELKKKLYGAGKTD